MSFILDALKKSESERQRKGAPGIADVPHSTGKSRSTKWVWIVCLLLAVNLAVLIGFLLKPDPAAVTAQRARPAPEVAAETVPGRFSEIVADVKSKQADMPAESGRTAAAVDLPVSAGIALPPAAPPRATVVDGLASFNELRANGSLQLPDLHLDIHVHSSNPSERFVFINMGRYKEGAILAEGPRVHEITPDGVVLEHFGTRFLLPRE